jgi:hypothetical protein
MAFRPTRLEMEKRLDALATIVAEINPCSVRQVFYQAVVRGVVGKTEAEYDKVQRALVRLRRRQIIPYGWIADGTRWRIKPTTFSSLEQAIERTARLYRRALWDEADVHMEIWLEKDALSGVVHPVTDLPRRRTVLQDELRDIKRDVDPMLSAQSWSNHATDFETRSNSAPNRSSRTRGFLEAKR